MTLCISGFCESRKAIAYVLDEQLTTDESAADILSKTARVNRDWMLSFCGNYIGQVGAVIDKVKRALIEEGPQSVEAVQTCIVDAQARTFMQEDVPATLPAGWTYAEFKRDGRRRLGEAEHERVQTALDMSRWGYDLLLSGFDDRGNGHIVDMPPRSEALPLECSRHRKWPRDRRALAEVYGLHGLTLGY